MCDNRERQMFFLSPAINSVILIHFKEWPQQNFIFKSIRRVINKITIQYLLESFIMNIPAILKVGLGFSVCQTHGLGPVLIGDPNSSYSFFLFFNHNLIHLIHRHFFMKNNPYFMKDGPANFNKLTSIFTNFRTWRTLSSLSELGEKAAVLRQNENWINSMWV